jgi:trans-o-hydroxybenzylidenepyruvate hydratase-aldolase
MLTTADLRGLYAIIPTPARPGAEALTATSTVDLDETERLISNLLRDGASGVIVLGTTGECATLSGDDYDVFVDCVCRVVDRRVPLFVGATALGGHEAYRRLGFARERGADGSLLGMPMWQPMTTDMALQYYAEVSGALPDLAIMVYANARAFRYGFPLEFWQALIKVAPTVIAAKYSRTDGLKELIEATDRRVNFMPIDMSVADFHSISPDTTTACWATAAAMGPEPAAAVIDAALAHDLTRLAALDADIAWTNEPIMDLLAKPDIFASYNIQIEKIRIATAGYCDPGPIRSPYNVIPDAYAEAARECGRRWAELRRRMGTSRQASAKAS